MAVVLTVNIYEASSIPTPKAVSVFFTYVLLKFLRFILV